MNPKLPTDKVLRAQAFNAAMTARPGELDLHIPASEIEGSVPQALRGGRVLSNGPGWTRIGEWTAHPFDGHGYMRAFGLEADGSCRLRARFVETAIYQREAAADRMLVRGFATNLPGSAWNNLGIGGPPRNVANTTIVRWGDALLAGWEGGTPHAMDPDSLATRGPEDFGGAIAGQPTIAHMRHDTALDRLVLCSLKMGRDTTLTWREVDRAGAVQSTRVATLPGMVFTHDFCFTDTHYIVGANPLRVAPKHMAKMLIGRSTLLRSVATRPQDSHAIELIPRDGGPVRTVRLPGPAFVVHFGNAFERDGTIVLDACVFPDFEFGEEFGYSGPTAAFDPSLPDGRTPQKVMRITIAPGATEASWRPLSEHAMDFPRFHPDHEGRETPMLFGAARSDKRYGDPFDALMAIDLQDLDRPPTMWRTPEQVFVGEPLFAPEPGRPEAGHILALLSDGLHDHTTLAIFDATRLDAGPVARIPMPLLPIAFHGDWQSPPN